MCGRYTLYKKVDELSERYNVAKVPYDINANFNVAPGQIMPVITQDEVGRHLELMKWGLIPAWAKDPLIGYRLINARDDGIFAKPVWRGVILHQRALIPADGFYEWQKPANPKDHKQPYYIHPKQLKLFSFAGVWESWKDAEGREWKTYSIITTEPNKEMKRIHNRMPVILHPADEADWLEPSKTTKEAIEPLLRPYEDNGLELFKVSDAVNSTRNNNQQLIYALSD
jgi:putative SOS response-associated peptidase YedK